MRDLSIMLLMWGYGLRISEVINKIFRFTIERFTYFWKGQKN